MTSDKTEGRVVAAQTEMDGSARDLASDAGVGPGAVAPATFGQVKPCAMCFGKLKPEDEDGASECESCGALWVEGT